MVRPRVTLNVVKLFRWLVGKAASKKTPSSNLKYAIGGFDVCEKAWCILLGVNEKRATLTQLQFQALLFPTLRTNLLQTSHDFVVDSFSINVKTIRSGGWPMDWWPIPSQPTCESSMGSSPLTRVPPLMRSWHTSTSIWYLLLDVSLLSYWHCFYPMK